jgi:predicted lipoprotein with Yx(FWY)xxD motif
MGARGLGVRSGWTLRAALLAAGVVALAACGSSSGGNAGASAASASSGSGTAPGSSFSVKSVTGLGNVLVDGRGRTVYFLTSGNHHNLTCDSANACTNYWPSLPLPSGMSAATAGAGVNASLLGTMTGSDGKTYPTYGGWLLYEYVGDSGPGQAHGEQIHSFGGVWYAVTAAGAPAMPAAAPAPTPSASTRGGYGY